MHAVDPLWCPSSSLSRSRAEVPGFGGQGGALWLLTVQNGTHMSRLATPLADTQHLWPRVQAVDKAAAGCTCVGIEPHQVKAVLQQLELCENHRSSVLREMACAQHSQPLASGVWVGVLGCLHPPDATRRQQAV